MNWTKLPIYLLASILVLNGPSQAVSAEEINSEAFLFSPIFPENQIPEEKGYFNLNMSPGQEQTVFVRFKNNGDVPITYELKEGNAFTTQNGGIQYTGGKGTENTHLLDDVYLLENYIDIPKEVVVKPHSTHKVPIKIHAPDEKEGSYLGAILFKTKMNEEQEKKANSFYVNQEVYMGIGIQLNLSKSDKDYTIQFQDSDIKFLPSGTQVYINTKNAEAEIIKGLKGHYKVSEDGNTLFEGKIKEFDMAPMSEVQYAFNWDSDAIGNKEYDIYMELTDGKERFVYNDKVLVDKAEFKAYVNTEKNKQNNPLPQESNETNITLYIIIAGLIAAILLLLFRRRNVSVQDENNKK